MSMLAGKLAAGTAGGRPLLIGIAVLLVIAGSLVLLRLLVPIEPLLRGWLVAFAIWSCFPIGSMAWLLIHRLTGGEWGIAAAPVLRPAAAMTPLLLLAFVPVMAGLHQIYPWAADPAAIPADVARWYLNQPAFLLRSLIALVGWSFFAVMFAAGCRSQLLAGLGLAVFGFTISLVTVDWYLSLEPHYTAAAFAAMVAIQQLLMALAIAALIAPRAIDGRVAGDLGGLMIATLLGVVYLEFMSFVVAWYGDLPEKAAWFLKRASLGWVSVLIVALAVGALLPFGMLMIRRIRRSGRGLRVAGALILVGTVLHFFWLLVPAFDHQASVIAVACAGLAILTLVSLLIGRPVARLWEARHAD